MKNNDYLILFGDLIGSTEVASESSPKTFSRFYIESFHLAVECATRNLPLKLSNEVPLEPSIGSPRLAGDEVLSFTRVDYKDNLSSLVGSAVTFAMALKAFWLAAPYNLKRLHEKSFPRDIAVGIHIGPAEPVSNKKDSDIAGLHINVTKRLETAARDGQNSRIFTSDDVANYFVIWIDKMSSLKTSKAVPILYTKLEKLQTSIDLKGIPVKVSPFELQLNEKDKKRFAQLAKLTYSHPVQNEADVADILTALIQLLLTGLEKRKHLMTECGIKNTTAYIDYWFHAIGHVPQIFFNDRWSTMLAFFMSCGFISHPKCNQNLIKEYQNVNEELYTKLLKLVD
ncbi:MAG: hypothetical protein IH914_04420 [candidate division Zixibacteria bacterium]|nr:hypothetical protein [candidate division Zixibacteria bacterium]